MLLTKLKCWWHGHQFKIDAGMREYCHCGKWRYKPWHNWDCPEYWIADLELRRLAALHDDDPEIEAIYQYVIRYPDMSEAAFRYAMREQRKEKLH